MLQPSSPVRRVRHLRSLPLLCIHKLSELSPCKASLAFLDLFLLRCSMSNAIYCSLGIEGREIRLVRLLPGQWADDIRCDLVRKCLSGNPGYQALSYVWGSQNSLRRILLNGIEYHVTVNLESALRRIRHTQETLVLWVDALCINQRDTGERNHQVKIMGDIFRSASNVFVDLGDGIDRTEGVRPKDLSWLAAAPPIHFHGEEDDEVPQRPPEWRKRSSARRKGPQQCNAFDAFSLLSALAQGKHWSAIPLLCSGQTQGSDDNHTSRLDVFEALRRVMQPPWSPWWQRIWVVQEIVVPPRVTVVYGKISAPWGMFAKAARNYERHARSCCSDHARSLPRDYSIILADFCQRVEYIDELRDIYAGGIPDPSTRRTAPEGDDVPGAPPSSSTAAQRPPLFSLLRRFRARKATDPRDKVFALLALADSGSIVPDYTLSVADVFRKATLESISSTQSMSVLTSEIGRKFRDDLPTWVPDWDAPGDHSESARLESIQLYSTSTISSPYFKPIDDKALGVLGRLVDIVRDVGDVMMSDGLPFLDTLDSWSKIALSQPPPDSNLPEELTWGWFRPVPAAEASWNILCADMIYPPFRTRTNTSRKPRRARAGDELMFVAWALLSPKSPFRIGRDDGGRLDSLLSHDAKKWRDLLRLKNMVSGNDIAACVTQLGVLVPDHSERLKLAAVAVEEILGGPDHFMIKAIADLPPPVSAPSSSEMKVQKQNSEIDLKPLTAVYRRIHAALIGGYKDRFPSAAALPTTEVQLATISQSILSATMNRRLFVTHMGHIGLGPAGLKAGDRLYAIEGGHTPFLLRSTSNFSRFELIGDCYAHGLMDSVDVQSWEYIFLV